MILNPLLGTHYDPKPTHSQPGPVKPAVQLHLKSVAALQFLPTPLQRSRSVLCSARVTGHPKLLTLFAPSE